MVGQCIGRGLNYITQLAQNRKGWHEFAFVLRPMFLQETIGISKKSIIIVEPLENPMDAPQPLWVPLDPNFRFEFLQTSRG